MLMDMNLINTSNTRFDQLDIAEPILEALTEANLINCTPIQAETLPLSLAGKDVAGQAQTGTGKTAAFLVSTFNRLLTSPASDKRRANQPRALILAPTRELAIQIHKDASLIGKYSELTLGLAYGGTGYDKQRKTLEQGVDILIGTPGRLIDYYKQKVFDLRACNVIVLDEADRMFDLGFIKDIRFLLRRLPPLKYRMNMLFSATLSYRVMELAYEHMNNPQKITIESEQITADKITERLYMVANDEKISLLIGLMQTMQPTRSIVFVNTKRAADEVWGFLQGQDIRSVVLSGDVPQKKRQRLLEDFQEGKVSVMVATDVAARGLHIPEVSHVFNYDLPDDPQDYVHRIGRTARAGASGEAISFACETYVFSLPDIEDYIEHKIPQEVVSSEILAEVDPASRVYPPKKLQQHRRGKPGHNNRRNHRSGPRRQHNSD